MCLDIDLIGEGKCLEIGLIGVRVLVHSSYEGGGDLDIRLTYWDIPFL